MAGGQRRSEGGEPDGVGAALIAPDGQTTHGSAPNARWKTGVGIALTGPAVVALALTMLYPIGWTVWLSVNTDRTVFQGAPDFVGLSNFVKVALSPDFQKALRQTLD